MNQQEEQKGGTTDANPPSVPSLPLVDDTESLNSENNTSPANNEGKSGSTVYKYRDFSTVNEDDEDAVGTPDGSPVPAPSRNTMETSIRVQKFPVKLYAILAQKEFNDIISWMPHGRSWKVLKPNVFESLVMPLFFEYSNYHSFNRLVNAWSFRRVSSGPDRGSYYHELFLRGKPHLQKYMRRLPKTHKKLPMRKQDEPDFYMLDKTNPLPSIEDAAIPGGLSVSNAMRGGTAGPGAMAGGMHMAAGMGGMPGAAGMGLPHQPVPPGMPGRMMPPPALSHSHQSRFPQGMYNADPLLQGGQDDYGDMAAQGGDRGMMSRGLMQSGNGAFRSPMHSGQSMTQGMPGSMQGAASAGRIGQQMGGRAAMSNQMYPSSIPGQFMNQMPPAPMRRFRQMGMESGMSNEQNIMSTAFSQGSDASSGQDDYYSRQTPMRRLPMDPMAPTMQQMYSDRATMGGQDPAPQTPYGDMQGVKGEMYGSNFRDMPSTGNEYMYRGEGGASGMSQMGGSSEEYMGMPMRRNRPSV